ncbi:MerR family transcriptional regulator [Yoonia sp. 2307UL14-13]|uniref:MerR family transcriptional regulator n=1 Tax=Yoonia sp. 2307UL14-13 TaxID=3126506 RepID=UPI0030950800
MTTDYLTIREMCELFDVTPRALRFYEAKELLSPVRQGTRRLFTRTCRARLRLILRGKRFGFSLEEMRQLLDLYNEENGQLRQLKETYELAQTHLADLQARRDELEETITEMRDELAFAADRLATMQQDGSHDFRNDTETTIAA